MVKTVRPRTYGDAIHVGHYFCTGLAVLMDLSELSDDDATSLVDFAAGLVIGLDGAMERVAPKVFLLRPRRKTTLRLVPGPALSPA